jgi:hypothetical protein
MYFLKITISLCIVSILNCHCQNNIQSIINNAIASGGEAILPSGTFRLDSPISVYGARNLKIRGTGTKLIFQTTRTNPNRYYDIQIEKSNGVTLQGIEIDMDPLPFTQGNFSYVISL